MPKSYRIRTQPNVDRNINVEISQDFDYLEILSLKLRQEDVYTRFCADYGVVVGRVIANGGFGIPNAKVSVFVPLEQIDENDPIISTLYPYRNLNVKNEDGFRYNLLPYTQTYGGHTPTGTFPTENDVLTRPEVLEVYEKYYKYTVKTNESGDFMIIGVPLGVQKVVMDLDLSDMGCFSLRPTDLVRMGLANEGQVSGPNFRSSVDLNSLPQIINSIKDVDVSSFWGQQDLCSIGITRVDFDLRDFGVDITPHSTFMGSIISNSDDTVLKRSCFVNGNAGNLCDLIVGPGQILAVRQTISTDEVGLPILEEYRLENGGNVIDDNGVWLVEMPMNLDFIVTNEFGEQIISNDPSIGIPTKGKYRFKIKWQNESGLQNTAQRANYLVPNVKEYSNVNNDYSYAFSVDWNEYGDTGTTLGKQMIQEAIDCGDKFYEFNYNKVYTVTSMIDRFKFGFFRNNFLSIKSIDDSECVTENNKFPVNDGVQRRPFSTIIIDILLLTVKSIGFALVLLIHGIFAALKIIFALINAVLFIINIFKTDDIEPIPSPKFTLPMLSYPECENCPCDETSNDPPQNEAELPADNTSLLSNLNDRSTFNDFEPYGDERDVNMRWILAGQQGKQSRVPVEPDGNNIKNFSNSVTLAHKINLLNQRERYFSEVNIIKTLVKNENPTTGVVELSDELQDNVIIMLCDPQTVSALRVGSLVTFNNVNNIFDPNISGASPNQFFTTSVTGETLNSDINLIESQVQNIQPNGSVVTKTLKILSQNDGKTYDFKSGVEYFQLITGGTIDNYFPLVDFNNVGAIKDFILDYTQQVTRRVSIGTTTENVVPRTQIPNVNNFEILFFVRGVDVYTPRQTVEYDLSKLFGKDWGNIKVTGNYFLNIPIQPNTGSGNWYQDYKSPESHNVLNNTNVSLFHPSYTFTPDSSQFSSFTTTQLTTYSSLDKSTSSFIPFSDMSPQKTLAVFTAPDGVSGDDSNNNFVGQGRVEGVSLLARDRSSNNDVELGVLYSPVYNVVNNTTTFRDSITINNNERIVFRSDRLPTSDVQEGVGRNSFLLMQNTRFAFYTLSDLGVAGVQKNYSLDSGFDSSGANNFTATTNSGLSNVIGSVACDGMVRLRAYRGQGTNLSVDFESNGNNRFGGADVQGGCYVLAKVPFVDFINGRDITLLYEWVSRYKFMYSACQGVFSQTFENNYVNGSLFMPAFETVAFFDLNNQVDRYSYCGRNGLGPIYFNSKTNNFYYKSSKYSDGEFRGQSALNVLNISFPGVNERNLWSPTTIMDLGPRDEFTKEICFSSEFEGYYVNTLKSSSYNSTGDLLESSILSRLINSSFLGRLFNTGLGSINSMFSRSGDRIDGDIAQMWSINSEYGITPYSVSNYTDKQIYFGNDDKATFGVFFESDRRARQLLTPGKTTYTQFGYPKTQEVPYYQWRYEDNKDNNLFGSDKNNWSTGELNNPNTTFGKIKYQNMDFDNSPYFKFSDDENLGYIYNENSNTQLPPKMSRINGPQFNVGMPYHFYFGLKRGKSALNRFYSKYILEE